MVFTQNEKDASRSDYHITQNGINATHFVVGQSPTDYLLGNTIVDLLNMIARGWMCATRGEERREVSVFPS